MIAVLNKKIPENIKAQIQLLFVPTDKIYLTKDIDKTKQNIFIFLCGFYQNLGDMALTFAQKSFLENEFPNTNIILIPSTDTYRASKYIKKYIKQNDIVTILGGGNMDDMYVSLEEARLHVVKSFPHNKIVSFPQTFAFSNTAFGIKRQEHSHRIYSRNRNLTIFVREPYSLKKIKEAFPDVNIGYCPDIVMSLDKSVPKYERHGVLCCLRSDKEQLIQLDQREALIRAINEEFKDVLFKDTVDITPDECRIDSYENTLDKFWDIIRQKKVVITDRLHCMVFCIITGTPCVVMDNSNHKIAGVYNEWVKENVPYIKFEQEQDTNTIISSAKELYKVDYSDDYYNFKKEFAPLRKALHEQ